MFKELYLQEDSSISKEHFNSLYEEYEKLLKKHTKQERRFHTVTKISDKQLSSHSKNQERHDRMNKRLNVIVKHSDRESSKVQQEKSKLELALEDELIKERALLKEIEDTQKEVVYTMGAIGETRSKETGLHVRRVAEYSRLLATLLGLNLEEVEILTQASPMHDIGKVAIADNILNKPAKLTKEEFNRMKDHSIIGYEMLQYSNRPLLKAASIVAYEHHEKYDGTGYPQGLSGDNIHIYGRITAVADVFDALGSQRVYKEAWDDEKIFTMFKEERGKHFDPHLIDIFFENLDDFLSIRDTFKD